MIGKDFSLQEIYKIFLDAKGLPSYIIVNYCRKIEGCNNCRFNGKCHELFNVSFNTVDIKNFVKLFPSCLLDGEKK